MRLSVGSPVVFCVRRPLACFMYCYGGHGCGCEGRANSACGIVSLEEKTEEKKTQLYCINFLIYKL